MGRSPSQRGLSRGGPVKGRACHGGPARRDSRRAGSVADGPVAMGDLAALGSAPWSLPRWVARSGLHEGAAGERAAARGRHSESYRIGVAVFRGTVFGVAVRRVAMGGSMIGRLPFGGLRCGSAARLAAHEVRPLPRFACANHLSPIDGGEEMQARRLSSPLSRGRGVESRAGGRGEAKRGLSRAPCGCSSRLRDGERRGRGDPKAGARRRGRPWPDGPPVLCGGRGVAVVQFVPDFIPPPAAGAKFIPPSRAGRHLIPPQAAGRVCPWRAGKRRNTSRSR